MNTPEHVQKAHRLQEAYFQTHNTKAIGFRLRQLRKLKEAIRAYEPQLMQALMDDLHKSNFEAYATEIGIVLEELSAHIKHLKSWAAPRKARTNLVNFKSESYLLPEPYGQVLIIAPWNYPFQLLFMPLVGAMAAGNTVSLKSSPYTPHTSAVMKQLIETTFDAAYITFFEGNREMNQLLLAQRWDYIFFTGSPSLGRIVMQEAAKNLTPVSLELGGKSPTIVCHDADLRLAAKRIAWGKFLNAGQTCLAPDYLFVDRRVKDEFLGHMAHYIGEFYGPNPQESPDFGRIVNQANVDRLQSLIDPAKVYVGGQIDRNDRYLAPTILVNVLPTDAVMQEEIFGPVFPVMEFDKLQDVLRYLQQQPKPLALYLFSNNSQTQDQVLQQSSSGGVCINEVVMHVANEYLPFGGVGNSGMGAYHGQYSFDTFSHLKAVLHKSTLIDVPLRYAPYNGKLGLAKSILS